MSKDPKEVGNVDMQESVAGRESCKHRPRGGLGWCVRKCEEASRTASGLCSAIVPLGRSSPGVRVSQRAGFYPH